MPTRWRQVTTPSAPGATTPSTRPICAVRGHSLLRPWVIRAPELPPTAPTRHSRWVATTAIAPARLTQIASRALRTPNAIG